MRTHLRERKSGGATPVHAGFMSTLHRVPGSRSRGGAWLYVMTLAVLVASFGAALVLIYLTP